jgi:hypothetical protein
MVKGKLAQQAFCIVTRDACQRTFVGVWRIIAATAVEFFTAARSFV